MPEPLLFPEREIFFFPFPACPGKPLRQLRPRPPRKRPDPAAGQIDHRRKKEYNQAKNQSVKGVPVMKAIGIVRQVDVLGRIVLPIELRRTMGIEVKDNLEIFVDGDAIVLKKYQPACIFCGEAGGVQRFMERPVCGNCLLKLRDLPAEPAP